MLACFALAFLAFVSRKLHLPRIVGSTGGLLPSKLADLAIYLTKVYRKMLVNFATFENNQFSGFLPRNVGKLLQVTYNHEIYSL